MYRRTIDGLELNVRASRYRSDKATQLTTLVGRVVRDGRENPLARGTAVRLEEQSRPQGTARRLIILSPLEKALGLCTLQGARGPLQALENRTEAGQPGS